ncbi:ABC transporter permease subunit [Kitasatospora xanthocidica]|uniref:ABC transporter permease subunit n=1 Tax=Kitasatospora xanthocidica TaxID=83382 RepID=A0A373A124_9ACTN|nr:MULTISPECIES: ABC transporter permease subunit [Streptomycetaceae]OKI08435.1 ABC transporter permease [Streptomyces sp. CB02056]RGD61856.1 ABC transporter permease subunit [Kitasatospora xanthocidica]
MTTAPTPVPTTPAATSPGGGAGASATATTTSPTTTAPGPRRRPLARLGGASWLAAVPLLLFFLIGFGLPAVAIVIGAFTTSSDAESGAGQFTFDNLTASVQGGYQTAMLSSLKLSALTALLATVLGLPLAQAVVTSRRGWLRQAVLTASGVLANFGGLPLAFAFVATLGNAGEITKLLHLTDHGWSLYSFTGLTVVYLYFLVPLMVLTITPALDGLRTQWREAAQNNRATTVQYWLHVALPILLPSLLGGFVLLFGSAFAAYATAAAMVGATVPLVSRSIADALSGNVLVGQGNLALALSLNMIFVAVLVMAVYLPLQRRSARWLS